MTQLESRFLVTPLESCSETQVTPLESRFLPNDSPRLESQSMIRESKCTLQKIMIYCFICSDAVDTVTSETWLKFRDQTRTSSKTPRLEASKTMHFPKFYFNILIASDLNFFQFFGIFPTCFACFLPANTAKKSQKYWNLINDFFATFKIARPEIKPSRPRRDLKPAKPRPSFETPSLSIWLSQQAEALQKAITQSKPTISEH